MKDHIRAKLIKLVSGDRYQRLLNKGVETFNLKAGHVLLNPGENIGRHSTGKKEEAIVIIKGKGEALIEGEGRLGLEENAVLYIPPDTTHDIKNTGLCVLEYVFLTSDIF